MFILVLTKPMLSLSIASQSMLMTESVSPILLVSIASGFRYSRGELLEKSVCMAYKNGRMEWKDRHHNAIL